MQFSLVDMEKPETGFASGLAGFWFCGETVNKRNGTPVRECRGDD